MKKLEGITQEMWPGVPVVPVMGTGATDSKYLREAGIPSYGVTGIFANETTSARAARTAGGSEGVLEPEFLYRLMRRLSS